MPVVAPVMLFMTVSSAMTGARLDRVQRALGALSEGLERVRHLMEAEDYARLESAAERLDEVGWQFEHGQRFTEGMKIALMLAKRDVSRLRRKFGHLARRDIRSDQDARLAVSDINLFVLSTLTDLRADALRLQLTLQDDPHYAERRAVVLHRRVEHSGNTFKEMLDRNSVESFREQLQEELDQLGWFGTLVGGRSLAETIGVVDAILDEDFSPVRSRMERWVSELESSSVAAREEAIVIYRERDGGREGSPHSGPAIGTDGCLRNVLLRRHGRRPLASERSLADNDWNGASAMGDKLAHGLGHPMRRGRARRRGLADVLGRHPA